VKILESNSKKESEVRRGRQELSKEAKSAFVYAGASAQILGSVGTNFCRALSMLQNKFKAYF
jgi:hypothetical protein